MGSSESLIKPDKNVQSTITLSSTPIPLFTSAELAEYDISPSKKKQYENQIKNIFLQFQAEYKNLYDERKKKNNELLISKPDDGETKDIRKNISILIIIGSSVKIQDSESFEGEYQKGADDLSTALLFRHLFSNSFCIPQEQILITSTQNSNFRKKNINDQLISNPAKFFKEIADTDPFSSENNKSKDNFYFRFKNKNEFMLNQDINLAQVNDMQYKFYMDEDIRNIVKPFNINIIKKELAVNNKSNLLVFLLDHEHARGFSEISYQFIVERLLCIDCKHFYVFNDSNFSGSIIKLINLSEEFLKIFPGIENSTLESALFYFLTNLNKVYSSDEQIMFNIDGTLDLIDDYDIDSSIKKVMKSKLQEIEVQMLPKISDFVLSLGYEFQSTGCVPHHFIQFAKKATIFTSSKFNQISLTLPGRKFTYSLLDEWRIRIFGSIFSSILIETLLDKDSLITLEVFRDKIYDKYTSYKDKYIKYIKRQNEYIQGETNKSELPKEEEIENFFSPETYKDTHFYSSKNNFPKLYKILLEQKYWNIDITEVNSTEYNDVYFSFFEKTNDFILKSFSQKQLAYYDIPNAKSNQYNQETINLLFNQFKYKYQASFCQRAKIIIDEMKKELDKKDENDIRKEISVLIIVGSSFNNQKSEYFDGEYQKDAEDLDTALLIRHLFRYAFRIQNDQILIVSTQNSDFRKSSGQKNEKSSDIYYKCSSEDEFLLYQHINLAQVGNLQYKFYFDENIKNIVKPFNINIIKEKLSTNNNSDLFVFFFNHGFDSMPYQFIINHLLEIQCKHFYVFNDSCYSGLLIKLIQISQNFTQIFFDIKDAVKMKSHFLN